MKNNRLISTLLLVVLAAIWGTISYRIYEGISSDDIISTSSSLNGLSGATVSRYEYVDNVKDPFQFSPMPKQNAKPIVVQQKIEEPVWVPPPFKLNGITINAEKGVALVEENTGEVHFLSIGEEIRGLKIVSISENEVVYLFNNQRKIWRVE